MKTSFLFFVSILSHQILFAQYTIMDTIYTPKDANELKYYQNGKPLRVMQLTKVLSTNPEAFKKYNQGKTLVIW